MTFISYISYLPFYLCLLLFPIALFGNNYAINGEMAIYPIPIDYQSQPKAFWKGQPILIHDNSLHIGIPITHTENHLLITLQAKNKTPLQLKIPVTLIEYPKERLTLKKKWVSPPEKTFNRILSEIDEIKSIFKQYSHEISPDLQFISPLTPPYRVSSLFGNQRILNGKPKKPHSGIDLVAPKHTPILSTSRGVVVLSKSLYFNGNSVIIDHGKGVFSLYCHLHDTLVSVGDTVTKGQAIGTLGNTGRTTAPHLHFGISINDARVNPAQLITFKPSKKP